MALPHVVANWPHERYQSLQQMPAKVHFLWQLKPFVIEHRVAVSYENPITFKKPQQTMEVKIVSKRIS
jgi:hypothetical protein